MADVDSVTLIAEDVRIQCSRRVLSAASEYFEAMFNNSGFVEASKQEIQMKQVSSATLKTLVGFVDTTEMDVTDVQHALQILTTACMLQFQSAIKFLEQHILKNLSYGCCFQVLEVADSCVLNGLYNKAKAISLWNFEEIWRNSEEFKTLTIPILKEYLSDDTLNIKSEVNIYQAISKWLKHTDMNTDEEVQKELLSCVRFELLSRSELESFLEHDSEKEVDFCIQFVKEIIKTDNNSTKGKRSVRQVPCSVVAVGGGLIGSEMRIPTNPQVLNVDGTSLTETPHGDVNLWGNRACVLGKDLYIVGGEIKGPGMRTSWDTSIWRYDSLLDSWSRLTDLPRPRRQHSIVTRGSFLYILGGFGKHRVMLDSVERYDTETDHWETLPSLSHPSYSFPVCACGEDIYVFTNSVQILTSGGEHWQHLDAEWPEYLNVMQLRTAIPNGSDIYLMGLHSDKLVKFDTVQQEFMEVGKFKNDVGYGCFSNGYIYSFMGEDSSTVETYNIDTGQFKVENELETFLEYHDVVALPKYPNFR